MTPAPRARGAAIQRPIAGIAARLIAVAALGLMFALVKLASTRDVHIVESVFYRQAFALPLILAWVAAGPGFASLRTERPRAHGVRMLLGLGAMTLNFQAMAMLPLAEATVIGFSVPLFATILAALVLREPTGQFRWGAVAVGFIGVLVVLRPDGAALYSPGAAVALAGALLTATVTIYIRQLGSTEPATTIVLWFTLLSLVPLSVLMLRYAAPHDAYSWAILIGVGLTGGVAQLMLTTALRLAPVAVVLPMDYTGLLWATLFGWLFFAALPAAGTLIGAPIIIASGLAILWREHRLGRKASADTPLAPL